MTNSQLQILFTPGAADNARISGIQILKIADVFSDTDGIPDWWRLAYFGHALGAAADKSRGSDDADGDGVSNLTEFLAGDESAESGFLSDPAGIQHHENFADSIQRPVELLDDGQLEFPASSAAAVWMPLRPGPTSVPPCLAPTEQWY